MDLGLQWNMEVLNPSLNQTSHVANLKTAPKLFLVVMGLFLDGHNLCTLLQYISFHLYL
jgi:hypothetical protein